MKPSPNPTVVLRIEFSSAAAVAPWRAMPLAAESYADDLQFGEYITGAYADGRDALPTTTGEILDLLAATAGWQVSADGAAIEACADDDASWEACPGLLFPAAAMQLVISAVREGGAQGYGYLLKAGPEFDEYYVHRHVRSEGGDIHEVWFETDAEADGTLTIPNEVSEVWDLLAQEGALWPVAEDPAA